MSTIVPPPTDKQAQPVPGAVFDLAAGIKAASGQIAGIEAERQALARKYGERMMDLFERQEYAELLDAIEGIRLVYGDGWKKATACEVPAVQTVRSLLTKVCNDGEGRWCGNYPLTDRASRPGAGTWVVYQLFSGEELVYIGSTGDLTARLKAHSRDKTYDSWRAADCGTEAYCRDLETALIDRYRPRFNRMIPTPRLVLR